MKIWSKPEYDFMSYSAHMNEQTSELQAVKCEDAVKDKRTH